MTPRDGEKKPRRAPVTLSAGLRFFGLDQIGSVGKWVGLSSVIGFAGGVVAFLFHELLRLLRENLLERAADIHGEGLHSPQPNSDMD